MKKAILNSLYAFLNGDTTVDMSEARAYINDEYEKQKAKEDDKANSYEIAKSIVFNVLRDHNEENGVTIAMIEFYSQDDLPEGFTKAKIQYGLNHYWANDVVKISGSGKAPTTYKIRG